MLTARYNPESRAGSLCPKTHGASDAEHEDETAQGDPEVGAEADEDDGLHLYGFLLHVHAGRRRQDGKKLQRPQKRFSKVPSSV